MVGIDKKKLPPGGLSTLTIILFLVLQSAHVGPGLNWPRYRHETYGMWTH